MQLILPIVATAAQKMFNTGGNSGTLSIVGLVTTEEVDVQIPRVESPDEATDAHWTALMQDGEAVKLTADNNAVRVPSLLLIRINKDAGVSSNAYGVRWS